MDKWKELAMRLQLHKTTDKEKQNLMDDHRQKWRAVLESIFDVITFLSMQNLPFRRHRDTFKSKNQGNFLETVKLLAKYNPSPNKHLPAIQLSNKMTTAYLFPTIKNELILLLSKK